MLRYNPEIHQRHSIRLKGYDYSQNGTYFVTVCVKDRECLFGDMVDGEIVVNDAGEIVRTWWMEIKNKFRNVELDEFVIMPNHFHGIIIIVGADLRVCPDDKGDPDNKGEHIGSPLHNMIQWFKTMTTNEYIRSIKLYGWQPFNGKLWQRNYYDHIIRNEESLNRIQEYIINNPLKWEEDIENPKNWEKSRGGVTPPLQNYYDQIF